MGIGVALAALFSLPAWPEKSRPVFSSTRSFTIDGKKYRVENSPGNDFSLIRKELLRQGIDPPLPDVRQEGTPFVNDAAREVSGSTSNPSVPLPHGLHAEHFLQMESETGPVALVLGTMVDASSQIRRQLSALRWECVESGSGPAPVVVATMRKGRETFIVLLEEKEGKFLLVRRME
jgi:hypothetical protein